MGSKTLNFAIKFVATSTKLPKTMEILKPFVENLLYETILPIMLVTHKDVTLFKDDPIEYIRNQQDFINMMYSAKSSALDLLLYLCQYRSDKKKRPDYL